jgi:hypothetical protein
MIVFIITLVLFTAYKVLYKGEKAFLYMNGGLLILIMINCCYDNKEQNDFCNKVFRSKISQVYTAKLSSRIKIVGDNETYDFYIEDFMEFNDVVQPGDSIIKPRHGNIVIIKEQSVKFQITEYTKSDFLCMSKESIDAATFFGPDAKTYIVIPKGKMLRFKSE